MVALDSKFSFRPRLQLRNRIGFTDETNIKLAVPSRRLAGVAFRQKLQDDALAEISRKRNVSLQSNTLSACARQQVSQTRHGGVSAIRRYENARFEIPGAGANQPIAR